MKRRLAIAALFAAAFVAIAITVAEGRAPIDLEVARWMAAHRSDGGVAFFRAIAWLGSVAGIVPLGLLCAAYLQRRRGWREVSWLFAAMLGATAVYATVMLLFHSERPPVDLRAMDEIGYSFPSGHSCQAVTFWIVAPLLIGVPWVRVLGAALLVLTALSRVYLGVHWLFDVLGGLCLGAWWTTLILALRNRRIVVDDADLVAGGAPRLRRR